MTQVVHPGSWIRMLTFSHPGSRGQKGTQSRIPDPDPQHWPLELLIIKGTVPRDFLLQVYHESSPPKPPKITLGSFQNFFKNLPRYSLVKVHHRYQRHTPAANLPPVSTTPAANFATVTAGVFWYWWRCQRYRQQICCRCQRHQWQIMGTISDCWHLKVNFRIENFRNFRP